MLGVINHMQDTLAWTGTFLHEKNEFKETDSSTTNNPGIVPTAPYPTHLLQDLTPIQSTIQ